MFTMQKQVNVAAEHRNRNSKNEAESATGFRR